MRRNTKPLTAAERWVPIFDLWGEFAANHRQLGLSQSLPAMRRFLMLHAEALVNAGVLAKASGKHWLGDVERFDEVAFLLAIGKFEEVAA